MKKAFLVTFAPTTMVVVDVPEGEDFEYSDAYWKALDDAMRNIYKDPFGYLCYENAEIKEDAECPYEPGKDDK